MLLRSIRSHLVASGATFALAFVVAAGAVAVVGASRAGHTPAAVAAMLALYGGVALAEQSARSTVDRIHDVALARLRGMTGTRLVAFAAGPLLAVSLVGIALGTAAGTSSPAGSPTAGTRRTPSARARSWSASRSCSARGRRSRWSPSSVIRRPLGDALSVAPATASWLLDRPVPRDPRRRGRGARGLRGTPPRSRLGPGHRAGARRAGRRSGGDVAAAARPAVRAPAGSRPDQPPAAARPRSRPRSSASWSPRPSCSRSP